MNDYDQFEAEMVQALWSLDEIESAWQQHLRDCENLAEYSVVYHDADPSYNPPTYDRD